MESLAGTDLDIFESIVQSLHLVDRVEEEEMDEHDIHMLALAALVRSKCNISLKVCCPGFRVFKKDCTSVVFSSC